MEVSINEVLDQHGIVLDEGQWAAQLALQELMESLIAFKHGRQNRLKKWLSRTKPPSGLYLWGSVGRGKTMLMDAFFQTLPYRRKRRIHFHAFMAELDLAYQINPQGEDPMSAIVEAFVRKNRVLCLDEVSITALSDAMLFARFVHHALPLGLVLVCTSNVPPDGLYRDGLQRERFLPAIVLLEQFVRVVALISPTDYRLKKMAGKSLWLTKDAKQSDSAESDLLAIYHDLSQYAAIKPTAIKILRRTIAVRALQGTLLWANFSDICGQGRTVDDYEELVKTYHVFFLSDIPAFSEAHRNEARRFIWLIDVLYDARALLVATAHAPMITLFSPDINMPETERTVSRLLEMQSEAYQSQGFRTTDWAGDA